MGQEHSLDSSTLKLRKALFPGCTNPHPPTPSNCWPASFTISHKQGTFTGWQGL